MLRNARQLLASTVTSKPRKKTTLSSENLLQKTEKKNEQPTAQNRTFASHTSRHTDPSFQKNQFSQPPQDENDPFKDENSYFNRLKFELN